MAGDALSRIVTAWVGSGAYMGCGACLVLRPVYCGGVGCGLRQAMGPKLLQLASSRRVPHQLVPPSTLLLSHAHHETPPVGEAAARLSNGAELVRGFRFSLSRGMAL